MSNVDEHIHFLRGLFDETSESGERCNEIADILSRLRADLAQRTAENARLTADFVDRDIKAQVLASISIVLSQRTADLARVTAERDEARCRICNDSLRMGRVFRRIEGQNVECSTPQDVAEMMGWDCFKENNK
jgi:hypothetical protein